MVVGKPLSMLMLGQNATVTICHSRTKDLADRCREAEIIVAAIGRAKHITSDMIAEGAVVADICAGSGTTAVAALNTGRRFICFENAPAIYGPAIQRIEQARLAVERGGKGV